MSKIDEFINFLSEKFQNVVFTSELNNDKVNNHFINKYTTYDFKTMKSNDLNIEKNIVFLNNLDGESLFYIIKNSTKVISPEGIMTHIGYYCKIKTLALLHFNLRNSADFRSQIISCKEWFPPDNYQYCVLKKNFKDSITKLQKRI